MNLTAVGGGNKSTVIATSSDDVAWHTTQATLTQEEEDAIVTLFVVVLGVAAIIILFSMGIFIDCRQRKKDGMTKRKIRLKMPPLSRRKPINEDGKSLASEMCPTGNSDLTATGSALV